MSKAQARTDEGFCEIEVDREGAQSDRLLAGDGHEAAPRQGEGARPCEFRFTCSRWRRPGEFTFPCSRWRDLTRCAPTESAAVGVARAVAVAKKFNRMDRFLDSVRHPPPLRASLVVRVCPKESDEYDFSFQRP